MQQTITNSVNISVLNSRVIADLCAGNFLVDLTPSVWIGLGATAVLGAKVKITNPYDVDVKTFPLSGYDIVSPMTSVVSFPVPLQSGNFQYGLYQFTVELTDANGTKYTITDNISICEPNPEDKTKKYGNIIARIIANCKQSRVTIMVDEPPVYKAKQYESKTQSYILTYPTGSGLPPLTSTANAFSVSIFPGEYLVKGDVCVTYNFEDNNYIKVPYKINCKKNVQCLVDLCCVFEKLHYLNQHLGSCHSDEVKAITDTILDSLRLIKTIELGIECGEDISDYISELEGLLHCKCSCSASANTPIVAVIPANNVAIAGCNVASSVNGLTTTYTIDNYEYVVAVNPASNSIIAISNSTLNACVKTQVLTFNISGAYAGIKTLINTTQEYNYWASVINNTLNTIPSNLLVCLGFTSAAWNALSFRDKFLAALTKFCGCCAGATCEALIDGNTALASGQNTIITWFNNTLSGVFSVDIFVDGNFVDTVLVPIATYNLVGYNDGSPHNYKLIAKCANGAPGNTLTGAFSNAGCPAILAPSLSSSSVPNATCPYNIMGLVSNPIIAGFSVEWHNANNLLPSTLVANPASVTSGTYYAFRIENSTKCSSPSSQVIIACAAAGNCTEPLNLLVEAGSGNTNIVTFNSAVTPPPTYLVKRRLASDPEVAGSYTNVGAPAFNLGTNKWEIIDTTPAANTLYVYKAESQCADASRPYATYEFAKITCPTLTPNTTVVNTVSYNFTHTGGQVSKYDIDLMNFDLTTIIGSNTHLPVFATPVTGVFNNIVAGTYKLRVTAYIGGFAKICTITKITVTATAAFGVFLSRIGNTLTAQISNGVSPFTYLFSGAMSGSDCAANTFTPETGTVTGVNPAFTSAVSAAAYQNAQYQFSVQVTDANNIVATSNLVTYNPCLVPETLITLPEGGTMMLRDITAGTLLFDKSGVSNKVMATENYTIDKLYVINDGLLKASALHIHPIFGGALLQSYELVIGQKLIDKDGEAVEITSITVEEGQFEVINISTETEYYVANGILTHNKLPCP